MTREIESGHVQGKLSVEDFYISEYGSKKLTGLTNSRDSIFKLGFFKEKAMDFNSKLKRKMTDFERQDFETIKETIDYLVKKLVKRIKGDVSFVDTTNESLGGIPAVKLVLTGDIQIILESLLCPGESLFNFNINKGYGNESVRYSDLYLRDYIH